MVQRLLLVPILVGLLACGGSGSETPPPVEPTSPLRTPGGVAAKKEPPPPIEEATPKARENTPEDSDLEDEPLEPLPD